MYYLDIRSKIKGSGHGLEPFAFSSILLKLHIRLL